MIAVTCNICGRDDWQVRFPATGTNSTGLDVDAFRCTCDGYGHHPQIVQCNHCGHVYANPRWVADDIMDAYMAVEDTTYLREKVAREKTFLKHLVALEKFTGPGQGRPLLDVGAYIGVFVDVACKRGWQAIGIEPSSWAIKTAMADGIPVIQGTLAASALDERRFEVITMWDVIEHLDDPSAELSRTYELLNPGGLVAVHTMDVDSLVAKAMGERWPWLMDMHVHYFNRSSLRQLLEQNGFEILWIGNEGRYLSLRYLASRLSGMSHPAGYLFGRIVKSLRLEDKIVPVNFGDLFTVYARRSPTGNH